MRERERECVCARALHIYEFSLPNKKSKHGDWFNVPCKKERIHIHEHTYINYYTEMWTHEYSRIKNADKTK